MVGCFDDVAWVRVEGPGSHQNSGRLREFSQRRIEAGTRAIVVDLANCPTMDSTFMGTLTALALELKRKAKSDAASNSGSDTASGPESQTEHGGIEILNANERNRQSMIKLGLQHLIQIDESGTSWKTERELVDQNLSRPLPKVDLDRQERIEMVLEAHEALVKANQENRSRFQDVLEYLQRDLESNSA